MKKTKKLLGLILVISILVSMITVSYATSFGAKTEASNLDTVNTNQASVQSTSLNTSEYVNVLHPPAPLLPAVGNGTTDDTAAIQAIINNCQNIYFPAGNYKITNYLILKSNIHLAGDANAVIEKHFATGSYSNTRLVVNHNDLQNITIEGLKFNLKAGGTATDDTSGAFILRGKVENFVLKNCTFDNCGGVISVEPVKDTTFISKNIFIVNNTVNAVNRPLSPIFYVNRCDTAVIADNYCSKGQGQAYLNKCTNSKIIGNTFLGVDNYWSGICQIGGIDLYSDCSNVIVDNNTVKSVETLANGNLPGIRSKNNKNITISNNKITWNNTSDFAICLKRDKTAATSPDNHVISNNIIDGTSVNGICLSVIDEGLMINNTRIISNTLEGKMIALAACKGITTANYDNTEIVDNLCGYIVSNQFANKRIQIIDNTVKRSSSYYAIDASKISESTIMGNKVIGNGVTVNIGINYSSTDNMIIGRNEFTNVTTPYNATGATNVTIVD